jgi:hypothetical protein
VGIAHHDILVGKQPTLRPLTKYNNGRPSVRNIHSLTLFPANDCFSTR